MPRSSTSSSLPEFEVTENCTFAPSLAQVRCPRGDCHQCFYVDLTCWHLNGLPTRPCPYCFKTAIVPGRDPTVSNHLGAP